MSSGCSVNDVLALIQLSWSAVEGARRACGKHDDLTKEVSSLYDVLAHVYSEMSVPESPIGQARRSLRTELQNNLTGCETQIRIINTVLDKFNALSPEQRFGKPLWPKIRFANGEDQDLAVIRSRMSTYSTAISMSLRLMSLGSRGKIERQLSRQKAALDGIRESVNFALAHLNSTTREKSLMAAYSNDSKGFWRSLRRELVNDGFKRATVQNKKDLIIAYMKELDSRGVLGYSVSFQKVLARENDLRQPSRQSHTPASFQSDSTYTDGRNSNTSFQSVEPCKYNGSPSQTFDGPVCIRTPSWPDSRSLTAVAFEQKYVPEPTVAEDEGYFGSPKASIPYRVRHVNSTEGSRTLYDEAIDMPTESEPFDNMSRHDSMERIPHHASMSSVMDQKIKFEDPHGREFSFPLSQAKTWEVRAKIIRIMAVRLTRSREWKVWSRRTAQVWAV
jgi:hypothetical protein